MKKNEMNYDMGSSPVDGNYQHGCTNLDSTTNHLHHSKIQNNGHAYGQEYYVAKNDGSQLAPNGTTNGRTFYTHEGEFFSVLNEPPGDVLRKGMMPFNSANRIHDSSNVVDYPHFETYSPPSINQTHGFKRLCTEEGREIDENTSKRLDHEDLIELISEAEKEGYGEIVPYVENESSVVSDASESSNEDDDGGGRGGGGGGGGDDVDLKIPISQILGEENVGQMYPTYTRCQYVFRHDKYPEGVAKNNENVSGTLPSFLSTFCTHVDNNKNYSICKNSMTGTTEAHMNPIMTSTYTSQYATTNSQLISVRIELPGGREGGRDWGWKLKKNRKKFFGGGKRRRKS